METASGITFILQYYSCDENIAVSDLSSTGHDCPLSNAFSGTNFYHHGMRPSLGEIQYHWIRVTYRKNSTQSYGYQSYGYQNVVNFIKVVIQTPSIFIVR